MITHSVRSDDSDSSSSCIFCFSGGQHLTKDEDNGWIVPLEQLTDADKQKADVENTKL